MSKHVDPAAQLSPKVKAGAWTGAALTVLAGAVAAGIAVIPRDAWDGLGVWALPAGTFVGFVGTALAAYAKSDWLRDLGAAKVAEDAAGATGAVTSPAEVAPSAPAPEARALPLASPAGSVDADGFTPEDRAALSTIPAA